MKVAHAHNWGLRALNKTFTPKRMIHIGLFALWLCTSRILALGLVCGRSLLQCILDHRMPVICHSSVALVVRGWSVQIGGHGQNQGVAL